MPVATMANPPEHDFAPSWLKIPNDNQLIAKPDQRAGPKYHHNDGGRQRSRHPSNESYPGFPPRHPPQPNIHGYRSRDEKRYRPGPRYHSLEDPLRHSELPSAYAPLNHHSGFLPPPPSLGYFPSSLDYGFHPKRGGPPPPLHNLNRLDPHGYHHGGRVYGGDGGGGRGRYNGGGGRHGRNGGVNGKAGPENGEANGVENGGGSGGAGGGCRKGDGAGVKGEEGKTNGDKSALSSHDFPSLSGDAERDVKNESSKPAGAWEKRPGTSNISIGGKKLQLVQKATSASDSPTTNGSPTTAGKMSPSGVNGVSNLSSSSKAGGAVAVQNKGAKAVRGAVPLTTTSTSVYKSLVPKSTAPTKTTAPRKPLTKEVVIRPAPVISSKDKSALPLTSSSSSSPSSSTSSSSSSSSSSTSLPSPSGNAASQSPSNPPVKEQGSPRSTSAIDIPTPRMVTGSKVKRTDKVDFLKELRRTGSVDSPRVPPSIEPLVNGVDHYTNNHENEESSHYHQYHRSSIKQYEKTNATTIYQQPDPFEDFDITEPRQDSIISTQLPLTKCNGHYENGDDNQEDVDHHDNEHNLLDCQPMELSSSLEAEKRLLQEMGWHEHSDNEEGYAPITEDERNEFKIRSQQMGKNGFSRPTAPIILNLIPHPVMNAITAMSIEDTQLSSDEESSDSSDDEL